MRKFVRHPKPEIFQPGIQVQKNESDLLLRKQDGECFF